MIKVVLCALVVSIITSVIIYMFSKLKRSIYKYIPSIVLFILSLWFFFQVKHVSTSFGDFGNLILSLIMSFSSTMTLFIAILLEKRTK